MICGSVSVYISLNTVQRRAIYFINFFCKYTFVYFILFIYHFYTVHCRKAALHGRHFRNRSASVMVRGASVHTAWVTWASVKAALIPRRTYSCRSRISGSEWKNWIDPGGKSLPMRDVFAFSCETMPSQALHVLQQRGFVVKQSGYRTRLPAIKAPAFTFAFTAFGRRSHPEPRT